ncbi:MAG: hypothetical protein ACI865_001200 [Flavobacteriaceae bacterium]|jgi:hypothetical protein
MKKSITLFVSLCLTYLASALAGGPDAYGYVWADSNEPGGPVYNWVDITTTGTLVSGLTDDNSVAFVTMGMNFHYYWGDYNQIKIGSNGWLGFDNIANISHCFPAIPTAGGAGDNYIAPFMTDLIFNGAGNNAEVYYEYDAVNDRFIVSYMDVPWWSALTPGYVGLNSFQVILNNSDSSIVYQYQTMDPGNFNDQAGCLQDAVIGIEAPTGAYGLSAFADLVPASNYAIKFTYPNPVLLSVPDIAANWNMNAANGGEFNYIGNSVSIPINLASVGNVDVTTDISAITTIQDATLTTVATFSLTIVGGLAFGTDSTRIFNWIPTTAGQFSITTTVSNAEDINPTNNSLVTELEIIDPLATSSSYKYVNTSDIAGSSLSWTGGAGQGGGVYIEPNDYPFLLESVGAFFTGIADDAVLEVYADDGPGGSAGTLLHTETMLAATNTVNAWNTSTMSSPIVIAAGGFYVLWKDGPLGQMQLGTVLQAPISRRSFEFLGTWEVYRENTTTDLMLEANGYSACASFQLAVTGSTDINCFGDNDGAIDLTVTGGVVPAAGYTFSWTGGAAGEDPSGLAPGNYDVIVTDSVGCSNTASVTINEAPQITLSATSTDEITGNDGTIDLTVGGGTAPYTYSWTNGAGTIQDPDSLTAGDYTVTVTDSFGCAETLLVTIDSQVGVDEISDLAHWTISPNPSNGKFTISVDETLITESIEIINTLGKRIQIVDFNSTTQVNISSVGIYYVVLHTINGKSVKKIVIN